MKISSPVEAGYIEVSSLPILQKFHSWSYWMRGDWIFSYSFCHLSPKRPPGGNGEPHSEIRRFSVMGTSFSCLKILIGWQVWRFRVDCPNAFKTAWFKIKFLIIFSPGTSVSGFFILQFILQLTFVTYLFQGSYVNYIATDLQPIAKNCNYLQKKISGACWQILIIC